MFPAFAKFMPFLPLLDKRLEDLTMADLSALAGVMGIEIGLTDELKQAGLALLQGQNIHTVADMVKSPESIRQLVDFVQGRSASERLALDELPALMNGSYMESWDVNDLPVQAAAETSVPQIISSPATGWRLPGQGRSFEVKS